MSRAIASLGPVGRIGRAPGTAGSLAALLSGALLMRVSPAALPAAVCAALPLGFVAVRHLPEAGADPGWVVVDELAGQWIAMLGLRRPTAAGLLGAFLVFRMLDIIKPGPVGWADRRHDALGVMLDDAVAGGLAAILLATTLGRLP